MAKRILIVDDEPSIRALLAAVFGAAGWHVETAADAKTARDLNTRECADVVLTDLNMPGESGCELAHWVAGHSPKTCVVLMSSEAAVCESCPLERRCPFLQKPLPVPKLVELIDQMMSAPAA